MHFGQCILSITFYNTPLYVNDLIGVLEFELISEFEGCNIFQYSVTAHTGSVPWCPQLSVYVSFWEYIQAHMLVAAIVTACLKQRRGAGYRGLRSSLSSNFTPPDFFIFIFHICSLQHQMILTQMIPLEASYQNFNQLPLYNNFPPQNL